MFNHKGQLLVTRRALGKKVWPGVWTNSVCGHPKPDESFEAAITRRLKEELGMQAADLQLVLPNYRYKTPPFKGVIEHEFCPVFVARATTEPQLNRDEVEEFRWASWQEFLSEAEQDSDDYSMFASPKAPLIASGGPKYSWWCKDQLRQLKDQPLIDSYRKPTSA